MAFKKAQFGTKNPTGDKAFNAITKNVFDPDAKGDAPNTQKPPKKPMPKKKGGGAPSYDTATNTYRSNC